MLGPVVGRGGADPDAGVVDQDVEAAETLAMALHDRLDRLLVGHVAGHVLDVEALAPKGLGGLLERVRAAGGQGQAITLLAQDVGEREPDPS